MPTTEDPSRRELLKKAAYVAPLIMTFPVLPGVANAGSDCTAEPIRCPE